MNVLILFQSTVTLCFQFRFALNECCSASAVFESVIICICELNIVHENRLKNLLSTKGSVSLGFPSKAEKMIERLKTNN